MKKEIIYTLPYETEKDIKKVSELKNRLYNKYNSVQVYPQGSWAVKIVASN